MFDKRFIIYETNDLIITHSRDPCTFGHYIVVFPRKGMIPRTITDLECDEYINGMEKIYKFSKVLKQTLKDKYNLEVGKTYVVSFAESTDIPFHYHVIPRYKSDYYLNYIGPPLMAQLWQPPSDELIPELCNYVREAFKEQVSIR